MCGRYSQTHSFETITTVFGPIRLASPSKQDRYSSRYNIIPSQLAPVILNVDGSRVLDFYRWGLIPFWAKDQKIGYKMINARCETVGEKPSYRRLTKKRRCLIPVDSFYEWQKSRDRKTKTPMRIFMRSEKPFALAGLWDEWRDVEGQPVRSYTILTTEANVLLKDVHDRMPVILRSELVSSWLDPEVKLGDLDGLFDPYSEKEMTYYPVSRFVNSPGNEGPMCWERVGE